MLIQNICCVSFRLQVLWSSFFYRHREPVFLVRVHTNTHYNRRPLFSTIVERSKQQQRGKIPICMFHFCLWKQSVIQRILENRNETAKGFHKDSFPTPRVTQKHPAGSSPSSACYLRTDCVSPGNINRGISPFPAEQSSIYKLRSRRMHSICVFAGHAGCAGALKDKAHECDLWWGGMCRFLGERMFGAQHELSEVKWNM